MRGVIFEPELETLPREQLRAMQLERLRSLVAYVNERVPLYRERLADVEPSDIVSVADLQRLPFTDRAALRAQLRRRGRDRAPAPGFPTVVTMWWVMMVAMMIPSASPTILLYANVHRHSNGLEGAPPTAAFLGGYLARRPTCLSAEGFCRRGHVRRGVALSGRRISGAASPT